MSDHITPEELHRLAANESIISAVLKWAAANGRRLNKADLERMGAGVDSIVAENERLTKERDEAQERVQRLIAERNTAQARADQVWKLRSEFSALLGTDDIEKGVESVKGLLASIKQLESEWSGWPALQREWFGDRYAAMQPWDAVRARIEDDAERIKRLGEAGDMMWRKAGPFVVRTVCLDNEDWDTEVPIREVDSGLCISHEEPPTAGEIVGLLDSIDGWTAAKEAKP